MSQSPGPNDVHHEEILLLEYKQRKNCKPHSPTFEFRKQGDLGDVMESSTPTKNGENIWEGSPCDLMENRERKSTFVMEYSVEGESLQERNSEEDSRLHMAARTNKVETINALLDGGVDVNTREANNLTPLHAAVR